MGININGCIRGNVIKSNGGKWKITNQNQVEFLTIVVSNDLYSDISLFHTEGSTSG